MSKYKRGKSSIAGLRFFHNWIKRSIIMDAATYLRKNYGIQEIKLLDLAVGKGGDMRKWFDSRIYDVVGIDIDEKSIEGEYGAKHRYNSQFKKEVNRPTNYTFMTFDLSNPSNIPKIDAIIGNKKFNIISCQFAIHYFYRDEQSLDTFMKFVTRYMDKDALFIGTTMDGDMIRKLFSDQKSITKKLYSLNNPVMTGTPYGNKIMVSLGEKKQGDEHYFTDKPSEEYIVSIEELQIVAKKYGLIYVGKQSFEKWYETYPKRDNNPLNKEEMEFSFLNFSFAFKKIN